MSNWLVTKLRALFGQTLGAHGRGRSQEKAKLHEAIFEGKAWDGVPIKSCGYQPTPLLDHRPSQFSKTVLPPEKLLDPSLA